MITTAVAFACSPDIVVAGMQQSYYTLSNVLCLEKSISSTKFLTLFRMCCLTTNINSVCGA
jgi:hypothetical protein